MALPKGQQRGPEWAELESPLGPELYRAVRSALASRSTDSTERKFLLWFAETEASVAETFAIYKHGEWKHLSAQTAAANVVEVIDRFVDATAKFQSAHYPRRVKGALSHLFTHLGELPEQRYPPFHRSLLTSERVRDRAAVSLASLGWEELERFAPPFKEEKALELLWNAAYQVFERFEAIFEFGQKFLAQTTPPMSVIPNDWENLRDFLRSIESNWERSTGVEHPSTWIGAGMPETLLPQDSDIKPYEALQMAMACYGAVGAVTNAVKVMFCIRTGWNREQIESLPFDPYAYRHDDEAGIGEEAFLAAYKARAGHLVSSYTERGFSNFRPTREHELTIWQDEWSENSDARAAAVIRDGSLLDVMDRYARLTAPIRQHRRANGLERLFFISQSPFRGLTKSSLPLSFYGLGKWFLTGGVTFPRIRQSYINVSRRRLGSIEITRHASNHAGTAVILTHYDDPIMRDELDGAVAYWQNTIQSAIIDGSATQEIVLDISPDDLTWFRHLAIVSGISASLKIKSRKLAAVEREYLEFTPSTESFAEVYLLRRAIIAARERIGDHRWLIQGTTYLGQLNAIRRYAFESGLGPMYVNSARGAFRQLTQGTAVLPPVLAL